MGCGLDKTARLRLFFGLEVPQSVKQQLLAIQRPVVGARWQRADQLHLTLVFLGSVEAQQLPDIRDAARNPPVKPFDLAVSGIGCFGHPEHPKNLWAGVQPVEELAELQGVLGHRLASCGFGQDKPIFRPHITLARFKRTSGSVADLLQDHEGLVTDPFPVDRFALFESTQGQHGSIYRIVETFPLKGLEQ